MLYIVIIFLLVSVYLYCLLGGADFGAGIIELIARGERRDRTRILVTRAMAPIWEANHMWLIITVVILFTAFPPIYSQIAISLSIPLVLLLIGIVLRGCAFTFRHYDAIKDFSQEIYSRIFTYSSLIVTFFFGLIIGSLVSGRITTTPTDFFDGYINPWFNLFSISSGIFLCCLFPLIASIYLFGDADDKGTRGEFIKISKRASYAAVISGGLVFLSSLADSNRFVHLFFSNIISVVFIIAATITLPSLWKALELGSVWMARIIAGAELFFILGAFYAAYFPVIVVIKQGRNITLFNSAAPEITLNYLGWSLVIGSLIIFPILYYLIKIFKFEKKE
jgi:cytochrome bd ubiquinol oxidase subunit II